MQTAMVFPEYEVKSAKADLLHKLNDGATS